jgi:hypothetical protein
MKKNSAGSELAEFFFERNGNDLAVKTVGFRP